MAEKYRELTNEIISEAEILARRIEILTKKSVFLLTQTNNGVLYNLKLGLDRSEKE